MKKTVKTLTTLFFLSGLTFFSFFYSSTLMAQGNLLVTPKRVVFDGNKRSEELNLANIGKDTATYIISFIQIRMKEDGTFERISQPDTGQNFADKNLRFFPRSVTLGPNEAQTVKVQLTKSNDLAPGEYRSHLYFRASPPEKPLGDIEPQKDSVLSVHLVPIFGISIPVIIRKGESTAKVTIPDINFQTERDTLHSVDITFVRSGNMSVYGDVAVDHISPQGKVTRVGAVKGLAVYTPNLKRRFHLILNNVPGVNFRSGKLHVIYEDQSSRPLVLADKEIPLN
jgi:hypothetical protein